MIDLETTYMGLTLRNPLVVSASPLSRTLANIQKMADAGAGAIVLWSIFEEQIVHEAAELDYYLHYGTYRFAESLTYFPELPEYHLGPEEYLAHIAAAKAAVDVPIIGSINGVSEAGWLDYATQIEAAGADGIELNVCYLPTRPGVTAAQVEEGYLAILRKVRAKVSIPVAVKLSPQFTSLGEFAARLDEAGADALVLFNRFYQPDIDVDTLEVEPSIVLSTTWERRLPLRWIAILCGRVQASLAASGGVYSGLDAAKMILAGADVVMMTSALLAHGIDHLRRVREELAGVMAEKEYVSVQQMRGAMSHARCAEPSAFERAQYIKALTQFGGTAIRE